MSIKNDNYDVNKAIELGDGIINGQACNAVRECRYGLFPMSYNGCEIIAIYNLRVLLGKKAELADIAKEVYPYGNVLMGLFGTFPSAPATYFKKHKLPMKTMKNYNFFIKGLEKGKKGVVSYWTKGKCRSSIHTVAVEIDGEELRVYNLDPEKDDVCCFESFRKFIKPENFIVGYYLDEE
ncbi:MAG: hypothetical protein K6F09_06995 [Clostridiales bacterium]|nr:hypothetical protein [Clostridiales bacterium]